jgi:hypothetical protein
VGVVEGEEELLKSEGEELFPIRRSQHMFQINKE